ncbi:MAG: c-type cytochrome [Acidobacteria bacterium]|nr:c-type cytochrome [Acidobacteriota bacterium]
MRFRSLLCVGVVVLGTCLFQATAGAQKPTSVLAGVYTADQARRGQAVYTENCAACHGDDLAGSQAYPALTGNGFVGGWGNVGEVFEKISMTMPATAPGSLTPAQNTEVLAFVLRQNKFPAGAAELAPQADLLKLIKIEPAK